MGGIRFWCFVLHSNCLAPSAPCKVSYKCLLSPFKKSTTIASKPYDFHKAIAFTFCAFSATLLALESTMCVYFCFCFLFGLLFYFFYSFTNSPHRQTYIAIWCSYFLGYINVVIPRSQLSHDHLPSLGKWVHIGLRLSIPPAVTNQAEVWLIFRELASFHIKMHVPMKAQHFGCPVNHTTYKIQTSLFPESAYKPTLKSGELSLASM